MASVRREIRINCSADEVWAVVGNPTLIHYWFPGMTNAVVDGNSRVITTATGITLPEVIVTNDSVARRFQYRIDSPIMQEHLGTIDVFDLHDGTSLVAYSTDAVPDPMALMIGGGTGAALVELKRQLELGEGPALAAAQARLGES